MKLQPKHIPNLLTIFRMVLVPIIIVFMLVPFGGNIYSLNGGTGDWGFACGFQLNFFLAGIFFVVACLSDTLDGYLARRNNWISNFGKLWDPIADKVLINSVLICFCAQGLIPIFIPIIMIARDVIVDASRMHASSKGAVIPANIYGKLKTVSQMLAIMIVFFIFNSSIHNSQWWFSQNIMMWLALFFSVMSGIIYVVNIYKPVHRHE